MTDSGEQSLYPAQIGADGKPEPNPLVEDVVGPFLGDLARCNKLPVGTFACVALHGGQEVSDRQAARDGKPARARWLGDGGRVVSTLRIVEGDWIEFEGVRIARLMPNLSISLIDRLTDTFEAIDDDAGYIAQLEDRIAELEQLKQRLRETAR
jgi:hypothetical protein